MPLDLSIPITATIALIVEDTVTRDYLKEVWQSPSDITFVLGGGSEGVQSIVKSFEQETIPNVFGVIDRDFQPTNQKNWQNASKTFRTFVLPVHEIENYLLDAVALGASPYHNRQLNEAAIEARMKQKARDLCWWAACRETIAELKHRFREQFIPDPTQSVKDENSATKHILESDWFKKLQYEASRSTEADLRVLLSQYHKSSLDRLNDGTWRQEFAGKEILRDLAGWICDQTKIKHFPSPDVVFYADLAKQVAAWQVANHKVPTDLTTLLKALRMRIQRLSGKP